MRLGLPFWLGPPPEVCFCQHGKGRRRPLQGSLSQRLPCMVPSPGLPNERGSGVLGRVLGAPGPADGQGCLPGGTALGLRRCHVPVNLLRSHGVCCMGVRVRGAGFRQGAGYQ